MAEALWGMPVGIPGPAAAVTAAAIQVVKGDLEAAEKHLRRADELVTQGASTPPALPLAIAVTAMTRAALAGEAEDALAGAAVVQDLQADLPGFPDPDTTALTLFATGRGSCRSGANSPAPPDPSRLPPGLPRTTAAWRCAGTPSRSSLWPRRWPAT